MAHQFWFLFFSLLLVATSVVASPTNKDVGSVGDDSFEARLLRRLEEQIQFRFDRLNEDNKMLKESQKKLEERVEELMPLNDKIEELKSEIAQLKANNKKQNAFIERLNKQRDNELVPSATGRQAMVNDVQGSSYLPRAAVPPTSCEELRNYPYNQRSGYYLIKDTTKAKLLAVFCDMDVAVTEMETKIGYVDVKTSSRGVYFSAYRTTSYTNSYTTISYDGTDSNVGNGLNMATGVFTAPVAGTYSFWFTARAGSANTEIFLNWEDSNQIGGIRCASYGASVGDTMALQYTKYLPKGHIVFVNIYGGSLYADGRGHTQFTGFLMEEDLPSI